VDRYGTIIRSGRIKLVLVHTKLVCSSSGIPHQNYENPKIKNKKLDTRMSKINPDF
jgi:hypothetical protein